MTLVIKEKEPLAPHTVYKIGGQARFFAEARDGEQAREALYFAARNRLPFFILGAGSNTLVSDDGFDGIAIHMTGGRVRHDGERMIVSAGVMMARTAAEAARAGLAGFAWAAGVPGTIGGSVRGNAGCFGREMKDAVESVEIFDTAGDDVRRVSSADCAFAYRDSIFKRRPEWVVLEATLALKAGNTAVIQDEMRRMSAERASKQDIGTQSCGCIFKNPAWPRTPVSREKLLTDFPELAAYANRPEIPAAFLIDRAGMKGKREGRIAVSPKHANFFINEGGGTAAQVRSLIATAQGAVREKYGIELREEIQYLGF